MKQIQLYPNKIKDLLSENIKNKNVLFVFPTDVVMNSWIDWIITNPQQSGTDIVSFENFTAWDNFKKDFVSAHKEGQSVIPAILRKMFITNLIAENSNKPRNERLQVIINPEDDYANEADSFSDWLSKNLQSLHFWHKRLEENKEEYGPLDKEDKDYLYIYEQYSSFLEKNQLFEPAWVDHIDFTEKEKEIFIFYPELLEDFQDYKDIFSNIDNISICTLPKDIESPKAYFYPDSRKELRQTMLSIIDLVNNKKADWSEITLSVPDLDTYRPYIQREFDLYEIPYVIKAGVSLTINSAGRIFREIYDCYNNNFSFDSVRTLLLDQCVPWKDKFSQIREDLIREGNRMRCICSLDKKDIWLSAFQTKINNLNYTLNNTNSPEYKKELSDNVTFYEKLKDFYLKLQNKVKLFFPDNNEENNFENILTSWMNFKSYFLKDDSDFSEDANNILGRCIKELSEIIEIEKKYESENLYIPSPFSFFLQELDKKTYTAQTKATGVTIFPYRLSAAAYFKYQFVIDCSQKNLDVSYKRLTYLNNEKRKKLKLTKDDEAGNASEVFIKLYCKDNNIVNLSAAENTFNGFAIPHSQLSILDNYSNRDKADYVLQEKELFREPSEISLPIKITNTQKESYNRWKACAINDNEIPFNNIKIESFIDNVLIKNRKNNDGTVTDKMKITARGDLEQFFPCPRKWLLKSVLKLHDDTLDTSLMQNYDMGNLNHKIMESFMDNFKDKVLPFYDQESDSFKIKNKAIGEIETAAVDYNDEIINMLYGQNNIVIKAIKAPSDFRDSPLAMAALISQQKKIADNILSFLKVLLKPYCSDVYANGMIKHITGVGNCTVIGVEEGLSASKNNFDYFGYVDCYLLSPDNSWIIIDYKNTAGAIPGKGSIHVDENGILNDFQMAVYYQLVADKNEKEIAAGYFYAIKDGSSRMVTDMYDAEYQRSKDKDDTDMDLYNTMIAVNEYSNIFVNKVSNREFTPLQSNNKKDRQNVKSYDVCAGCSFKSICRTTYTVGGKEINFRKADSDGGSSGEHNSVLGE